MTIVSTSQCRPILRRFRTSYSSFLPQSRTYLILIRLRQDLRSLHYFLIKPFCHCLTCGHSRASDPMGLTHSSSGCQCNQDKEYIISLLRLRSIWKKLYLMAVISQLNAKDLSMTDIAEIFDLEIRPKHLWELKEESMINVPSPLRNFHCLALSHCNID